MSRPISDAWFHRLKSATRDLVKACGGVVRAAELTHVSKTEVSRWQVATDPDVISLPAALALEADCGLALVTTVMADLNGRRLTDPHGDVASASTVFARHADAVRAAAEMMSVGAQAAADNDLTMSEAEILDRSASEVERAVAKLRRDLAGIKAGPSGLKVVG